MIPGFIAVPLAIAAPVIAIAFAIQAFKRRSWRAYRILATASSVSSLFTLVVIGYVAFFGRSEELGEAMTRMRLGLCYGGLPAFTATVALMTAGLGAALIRRRTDEGRPEATVGRPMQAVISVMLIALLTLALTFVAIQGRPDA